MQEDDAEYLKRLGFDSRRIAHRYRTVLEAIDAFLCIKKLTRVITIDKKLLKTAVYDYFVDIARLKEFHRTPAANFEKVHGYMAYWLLRRKPLQAGTASPESAFVNELFITSYLTSNLLSEKGIDTSKNCPSKAFNEFQSLLMYNLQYRPVSQQSLELMAKAFFFCGYDFER